jgi:acetolactate synthase-1/2/3 large subunit
VFQRNYPAALTIAADASAFASALLPLLTARGEWGDTTEHMQAGHRDLRESRLRERSDTGVSPALLFDALERAAPQAIYATDSGNGTFLAMEHLRLDAPGRLLAPVDFSCMGYAVPAAIGAKLANPDRDVVALPGDGALLMTGLETLTAAAYSAGVVVCVLRDGELAQIAQFQRTALGEPQNSVLPPFEISAMAAAVGADYLSCRQDVHVAATLGHAFEIARSGRPVIVDVAIDYTQKTFFTKGIVTTTFWRLPWMERLRMIGRTLSRQMRRLD